MSEENIFDLVEKKYDDATKNKYNATKSSLFLDLICKQNDINVNIEEVIKGVEIYDIKKIPSFNIIELFDNQKDHIITLFLKMDIIKIPDILEMGVFGDKEKFECILKYMSATCASCTATFR